MHSSAEASAGVKIRGTSRGEEEGAQAESGGGGHRRWIGFCQTPFNGDQQLSVQSSEQRSGEDAPCPTSGWAAQHTQREILQSASEPSAAIAATNALPGGRAGMAHARRVGCVIAVARCDPLAPSGTTNSTKPNPNPLESGDFSNFKGMDLVRSRMCEVIVTDLD